MKREKSVRRQLSQNQHPKTATLLPGKATDHQSATMKSYTQFYCIYDYLRASFKQIRNINLEEKVEGKGKKRKKGEKTVFQVGTLVRSQN